jgi:hypothetical protein
MKVFILGILSCHRSIVFCVATGFYSAKSLTRMQAKDVRLEAFGGSETSMIGTDGSNPIV